MEERMTNQENEKEVQEFTKEILKVSGRNNSNLNEKARQQVEDFARSFLLLLDDEEPEA